MINQMRDDVYSELQSIYVKSFPDKLKNFRCAESDGSADRIRRLGHQLKGSGAAYGFPRISELGESIESAAENDQWSALKLLIAELEAVMNRISPVKHQENARE